MKTSKKDIGKIGEDIACRYLKDHGYKIVKRNLVLKSGELDVVCYLDEILVLVEVRTKRPGLFYFPEETVGFRKLSKLLTLAEEYCEGTEYSGICRIDVIGIRLSKDCRDVDLRHYEGIT